jgi:hypothetical protein
MRNGSLAPTMPKRRARSVVLDLPTAGGGHPGITPALWAAWAEAAVVTLERFHPPPSKACTLTSGLRETAGTLKWRAATAQMRVAHGNEQNATEYGAYVIASAALGSLEGWRIAGRAQHASGADFVMLPANEDDEEAFVRLEVSGMAKGADARARAELKNRLSAKLSQLREGDENEPGVAAVFGYELTLLLIATVKR